MDRISLVVGRVPVAAAPKEQESRLPATLLRSARERSESQGERLLDALESLSGMEPSVFVKSLGATLRYPVLDSDALFNCAPVFDRVTLAQALKREFVMLRLGQVAPVDASLSAIAFVSHKIPVDVVSGHHHMW